VSKSLRDAVEANRGGQLGQRLRIGFETPGQIRLERRLVALGVERRLPTLGRGQHDFGAGVLEGVIRGSQLFEPETGLEAGAAQFVVRGEDHEDFHLIFPVMHFCVKIIDQSASRSV